MKKSKSRAILLAALCLISALVFSACGSPTSKKSLPTIKDPIDLTISIVVDENTVKAEGYKPVTEAQFIANKGASVLEATQLYCVSNDIEHTLNQEGTYITRLNGLSEKDYSETTGWVYTVNGKEVTVGCKEYILSDGDSIEWKFVDFSTTS